MSFILGSITLPNPTGFERQIIETSTENLLLNGRTNKRIENRKERYVLKFSYLTTAEVGSILSEYELNQIRPFSVSETNLSIVQTGVHIDLQNREYALGTDYRENLVLVLTEAI